MEMDEVQIKRVTNGDFSVVWLELLRKTNGGVGGVDATAGASW